MRGDGIAPVVAGSMFVVTVLVISCGDPGVTEGDAYEPLVRPNLVWIVAGSVGAQVESQLQTSGGGATMAAALDTVSVDTASVRSALLTGVHPQALMPVPRTGVSVVPVQLRHGGYYTSRLGNVHHNLLVKRHHNTVHNGDTNPELTQPGLLGAWDVAGPDANWRDRDKDWDFPCTVSLFTTAQPISIGCGGDRSADAPFFALFNLSAEVDGQSEVAAILDALAVDGLTDQTAVFVVEIGAGKEKLTVRWPTGWEPADVFTGELSVLDLAPTTLVLAGLPVPQYLTGRPLVRLKQMDATEQAASLGVAPIPTSEEAEPADQRAPRVAATPVGYPAGGLFHVAPRVKLWCDTPGSTIVYTTEREAPFYWRLYRGPFRMRFWELRVQCGRLGYQDGPIVTYAFDIE